MFSLTKPGVGNRSRIFRIRRAVYPVSSNNSRCAPFSKLSPRLYSRPQVPRDIAARNADIAESSESARPEKPAGPRPNPDA